MLKSLSSTDIIIILVAVFILFGSRKIPEFVRGIGEAVKEFKKAVKDEDKK